MTPPQRVRGAGVGKRQITANSTSGAELRQSLDQLSLLPMADLELQHLLHHVAGFAVRAIPNAEGAGIAVRETFPNAVVATAAFVSQIEAIQFEIGEGPCITAATERRTVRSGALASDAAWPRFGARVQALGVHSVLSLPLLASDDVLGAVNLYAHAPQAFDERAVELGELFAAPAAIAVQNARALARAQSLADNLRAALVSRPVIDQAIGILMSRTGGTSQEAFDRLKALSQGENRKVSVIAQQVVDEAVRRARARHDTRE